MALIDFRRAVKEAAAEHAATYGLSPQELEFALLMTAALEGGLGEEAGINDSPGEYSVGRFQFNTSGGHGSTLLNQGYTLAQISDDEFQAHHWAPLLAAQLADVKEEGLTGIEAVRQAAFRLERPRELYPMSRVTTSADAAQALMGGEPIAFDQGDPTGDKPDVPAPKDYRFGITVEDIEDPNANKKVLGAQLTKKYYDAQEAWEKYKGSKGLVEEKGRWGHYEEKVQTFGDLGLVPPGDPDFDTPHPTKGKIKVFVPDTEADRLIGEVNTYKNWRDRFNEYVKSDFYGVETATRSYLDTEKDRAGEAQREFTDFVSRVKTMFDFEDSSRSYAMAAEDQNAQNWANADQNPLWGGMQIYSTDRPSQANRNFADEIGETLEGREPPDFYSLDHAIPGFAMGTDARPAQPMAAMSPEQFMRTPIWSWGPEPPLLRLRPYQGDPPNMPSPQFGQNQQAPPQRTPLKFAPGKKAVKG